MKVKRLVSIGLAVCLTLAFSVTAFAATPSPSTPAPALMNVFNIHHAVNAVNLAGDFSAITATQVSPQFYSTQQPWVGYSGEVKCTANPYLQMRTGPGVNYQVHFSMDYGQVGPAVNTVRSSDGSGNWCQFQAYDGTTVYGSANYLQVPPYTF